MIFFCHVLSVDSDSYSVLKMETARSSQWRTQKFCSGGGGVQQIELRTEERERERGSGGGSLLVRGSGGSCNLVQEISFHIVKFS